MKDYFTTTELAKLSGLHRSYIHLLISRGKIPAQKIGDRWLIRRKSALKWLESRGIAVDECLISGEK